MIRKANSNANETNQVMAIWLESTIKAHPFIPEAFWHSSYKTVKDVYIPNSEVYVYTENDAVIGFIGILNKNYIGALFINTEHQGKGIGKKLINYACEKYKRLSLAVYKENVQAVKFYEKMGFVIEKEQQNEETNVPEYIMSI